MLDPCVFAVGARRITHRIPRTATSGQRLTSTRVGATLASRLAAPSLRYVRLRCSLLRFILGTFIVGVLVGCEWRADFEPCDENGIAEGVYYTDGQYLTPDGFMYAKAGERPFDGCTVMLGDIVLRGEIPHFDDFDSFEEIGGFYDYGFDAPDPPEGWSGGLVKGFPNLRRITRHVYDTNGFLERGSTDGGFYFDGFESLEYVEGDFSCAGSVTSGQSSSSSRGKSAVRRSGWRS